MDGPFFITTSPHLSKGEEPEPFTVKGSGRLELFYPDNSDSLVELRRGKSKKTV